MTRTDASDVRPSVAVQCVACGEIRVSGIRFSKCCGELAPPPGNKGVTPGVGDKGVKGVTPGVGDKGVASVERDRELEHVLAPYLVDGPDSGFRVSGYGVRVSG